MFGGCKRVSHERVFWGLWVLVFPPKPQFSKPKGLLWFWREEQSAEFSGAFFGGTSFCVCWMCLQPRSKNWVRECRGLWFSFGYCGPLELAGWFTTFNFVFHFVLLCFVVLKLFHVVYTANQDCLRLLWRICHCWQMFFLFGVSIWAGVLRHSITSWFAV